MKVWRPKRRLFLCLGAMVMAFVFVAVPATAWSLAKYPPYNGNWMGYYNTRGYIGNFEVYRRDLSANPTDGSIQFHLGTDTGPPTGGDWIEGYAGFSGAGYFFTAPYTGPYLIDYYFHIVSGNAQAQTWPMPPPGAASVQLILQFGGNLQDQNGMWALNGNQMTTVYSAYVVNPLSIYWPLSGVSGKVEFTTPTLTLGLRYYIYFYEFGVIQLNWPLSGLYSLGLFDMNAKLDYATAFTNSGPGGCVQKNTPILTPSGYVPVQKLNVGDTVISYDLASNQLVPSTVTSISATKVANILDINNGSLRLTPYNQPIYMKNSTYTGWLRNPGELVAGDYVFNPTSGNWTFVTQLFQSSGSFTVYDVVTSGPKNYVANGLLLLDK